MTRTSIARLEDGSLSRWQTEAWTRRRESNSLVGFCRPYPGRLGPSCWLRTLDSNPRHPVQSRTYSLSIRNELVRVAGFDPAVSCVRGTRFTRLSYTLMEHTAGVEPAFSVRLPLSCFVGRRATCAFGRAGGFRSRFAALRTRHPGR